MPARLRAAVDYCADGLITTLTPADDGSDDPAPLAAVRRRWATCSSATRRSSTRPPTTPPSSRTTRPTTSTAPSSASWPAAETTAAASACPTDELAEFTSSDYTAFVRSQLADRFRLAEDDVVVVAGRPGRSDDATKDDLRAAGELHQRVRPGRSVGHLRGALDPVPGGDGEAVTDACYLDPGARDLDDLDSVNAPRPRS